MDMHEVAQAVFFRAAGFRTCRQVCRQQRASVRSAMQRLQKKSKQLRMRCKRAVTLSTHMALRSFEVTGGYVQAQVSRQACLRIMHCIDLKCAYLTMYWIKLYRIFMYEGA